MTIHGISAWMVLSRSSGSPLILINIQISLAVGPHGECLIGLDWYTFFYSKGMGAFTGQSESVPYVIRSKAHRYMIMTTMTKSIKNVLQSVFSWTHGTQHRLCVTHNDCNTLCLSHNSFMLLTVILHVQAKSLSRPGKRVSRIGRC